MHDRVKKQRDVWKDPAMRQFASAKLTTKQSWADRRASVQLVMLEAMRRARD